MAPAAIDKRTVSTSFGDIAYVERGTGDKPPVLFVHGIPTSSYLWRDVIAELDDAFHCYAPDLLGLGDTVVDPDADLFHMDAQAEMLVEMMSALGHDRFAIVCHDQGGAAAQIIAERFPDKITCMVMTNCVCYDNWPVPVIRRLQQLSRLPLLAELMSRTGLSERLELSRWSSFRKGVSDPSNMSDESIREYLRPMRESRDGRRRFRSFLLAGDPSYTQRAARALQRFDRPTLVLWAEDDRFLPVRWGERLAADIPGCVGMVRLPGAGHFWQEERPGEAAALMRPFLEDHATGGTARVVKLPVVGQAGR
jgi:pimeloyl-ACP methyl ester carboxylesterase